MHTAMRAGQQITRLTALTRPTHCLCGHSNVRHVNVLTRRVMLQYVRHVNVLTRRVMLQYVRYVNVQTRRVMKY